MTYKVELKDEQIESMQRSLVFIIERELEKFKNSNDVDAKMDYIADIGSCCNVIAHLLVAKPMETSDEGGTSTE